MGNVSACSRSSLLILCLFTLGCETPEIGAPEKLRGLTPLARPSTNTHALAADKAGALAKSDAAKTIAIEGTRRWRCPSSRARAMTKKIVMGSLAAGGARSIRNVAVLSGSTRRVVAAKCEHAKGAAWRGHAVLIRVPPGVDESFRLFQIGPAPARRTS